MKMNKKIIMALGILAAFLMLAVPFAVTECSEDIAAASHNVSDATELSTAITNATAGDTILMDASFSLSAAEFDIATKTLTLDTAGYTLTVITGATLKIAAWDDIQNSGSVVVNAGGKVTINAVDLVGTALTSTEDVTLEANAAGDGTDITVGNAAVADGFTVPAKSSIVVPEGKTLTVNAGKTLTMNGALDVQGTLELAQIATGQVQLSVGATGTVTFSSWLSLKAKAAAVGDAGWVVVVKDGKLIVGTEEFIGETITLTDAAKILPAIIDNGANSGYNMTLGTSAVGASFTIPAASSITVTAGKTLTLDDGVVLTVNGTLTIGDYVDAILVRAPAVAGEVSSATISFEKKGGLGGYIETAIAIPASGKITVLAVYVNVANADRVVNIPADSELIGDLAIADARTTINFLGDVKIEDDRAVTFTGANSALAVVALDNFAIKTGETLTVTMDANLEKLTVGGVPEYIMNADNSVPGTFVSSAATTVVFTGAATGNTKAVTTAGLVIHINGDYTVGEDDTVTLSGAVTNINLDDGVELVIEGVFSVAAEPTSKLGLLGVADEVHTATLTIAVGMLQDSTAPAQYKNAIEASFTMTDDYQIILGNTTANVADTTYEYLLPAAKMIANYVVPNDTHVEFLGDVESTIATVTITFFDGAVGSEVSVRSLDNIKVYNTLTTNTITVTVLATVAGGNLFSIGDDVSYSTTVGGGIIVSDASIGVTFTNTSTTDVFSKKIDVTTAGSVTINGNYNVSEGDTFFLSTTAMNLVFGGSYVLTVNGGFGIYDGLVGNTTTATNTTGTVIINGNYYVGTAGVNAAKIYAGDAGAATEFLMSDGSVFTYEVVDVNTTEKELYIIDGAMSLPLGYTLAHDLLVITESGALTVATTKTLDVSGGDLVNDGMIMVVDGAIIKAPAAKLSGDGVITVYGMNGEFDGLVNDGDETYNVLDVGGTVLVKSYNGLGYAVTLVCNATIEDDGVVPTLALAVNNSLCITSGMTLTLTIATTPNNYIVSGDLIVDGDLVLTGATKLKIAGTGTYVVDGKEIVGGDGEIDLGAGVTLEVASDGLILSGAAGTNATIPDGKIYDVPGDLTVNTVTLIVSGTMEIEANESLILNAAAAAAITGNGDILVATGGEYIEDGVVIIGGNTATVFKIVSGEFAWSPGSESFDVIGTTTIVSDGVAIAASKTSTVNGALIIDDGITFDVSGTLDVQNGAVMGNGTVELQQNTGGTINLAAGSGISVKVVAVGAGSATFDQIIAGASGIIVQEGSLDIVGTFTAVDARSIVTYGAVNVAGTVGANVTLTAAIGSVITLTGQLTVADDGTLELVTGTATQLRGANTPLVFEAGSTLINDGLAPQTFEVRTAYIVNAGGLVAASVVYLVTGVDSVTVDPGFIVVFKGGDYSDLLGIELNIEYPLVYEFRGWYTATNELVAAGDIVGTDLDHTLYAKWNVADKPVIGGGDDDGNGDVIISTGSGSSASSDDMQLIIAFVILIIAIGFLGYVLMKK